MRRFGLPGQPRQQGLVGLLFSSSCSLYGKGGDEELDEGADFNPVTPYGQSKVDVEQALSHLADADFSPVYLRNATAYGLSRRLRADVKCVTTWWATPPPAAR